MCLTYCPLCENRYSALLAFLKHYPQFSDKAISQSIIKRWFKTVRDKASDAPSNVLQRHIRLKVVEGLAEILGHRPYCASKYLA